MATSLEESIFKEFKQTNPKYKNQVHGILERTLGDYGCKRMTYHHSSSVKVRSRVFNLKDKKNRGLREGLLLVIPFFNTLGLEKKSIL